MFDALVLGLATLFSFVLPVAIVFMRDVVKRQRQGCIRELTTLLGPAGNEPGFGIIPSIEFVKFKYFLDQPKGGKSEDIPFWAWLVSSVPLMMILSVLGVFAFSILLFILLPAEVARDGSLPPLARETLNGLARERVADWAWILVAAFLGGYLFMVRSLLRAIHNFDLSPASFIASSVHLLFGVATAMIIIAAAKAMLGEDLVGAGVAGWLAPSFLIAAFVVGFFPELGLRALLRRTRLRDFKQENPSVYGSFHATPVEVIDGVDSEVRQRLSDYHIVAVQNLATANPVMLFVETPFGIYQVMDWVAQAQLCCSVGPACMTELWKLGVRTIFDLERVGAEGQACSTPQLRQAVGRALFRDLDREELGLLAHAEDGRGGQHLAPRLDDATVIADIQLRLDDPHVHRLRQIFVRVQERLGAENRRLPGPRPAPGTRPHPPAGRRRENGTSDGPGDAPPGVAAAA
jgi:hypothetical protein